MSASCACESVLALLLLMAEVIDMFLFQERDKPTGMKRRFLSSCIQIDRMAMFYRLAWISTDRNSPNLVSA